MTRDAAAAIQLPQEDPDRRGRRPDRVLLERPHPNRYLDCWVRCHYFFVRKVLLFKYSYAFVALPGGFGTSMSCSRR